MLFALAFLTAGCAFGGDENEESLQRIGEDYPGQVFYVGGSFEGLPLEAALSGEEVSPGTTADFIYGDCEPTGSDGGCPVPLTIQNSICPNGRTAVGIHGTSPAMERRAAAALRPVGGTRRAPPKISLGEGPRC